MSITYQALNMPSLAGQRFGMLRVLGVDPTPPAKGHTYWQCVCDCGGTKSVRGERLRRGSCWSCGCQKGNPTHRGSRTPLYKVWTAMHRRCSDPKDPAYVNYGARGIYVCDRWRSFEHFRDDMGPRPSTQHSVERKDNDGPYSPDNCVWADWRTQSRNKRRNIHVTAFGETKVAKDWAADPRCAVGPQALTKRLRRGWDAASAITTPPTFTPRPGSMVAFSLPLRNRT